MTVGLSPVAGAGWQFFDANGVPLSGGKLYTYVAGTTTPQTTYTSISGVVANENPIILNSEGRVSGTNEVWLDIAVAYKLILKTSADVQLWSADDLSGIAGLGSALPVASGGTGSTTLTLNNVLLGNGTSAVQLVAPGTSGNLLTSNGTTWASVAAAGVTTFSAGTTGLTPSTGTSGAVSLAGTLVVANGGTGAATIAANNVILGNGTSAVQVVAPSTSGNVLSSNGSTWQSLAPALKAWVKFNGSTGVIAASYNVTSVTVHTTGTYTINFTTAISDANYTVVTGGAYSSGVYAAIALRDASNPATTTTLPIVVYQITGGLINIPEVDVAVFR